VFARLEPSEGCPTAAYYMRVPAMLPLTVDIATLGNKFQVSYSAIAL
jgi:hypothetical protein